ncbi:MAG: hypothetical protein ABW190_04215 [Rhizobacter sp.]
MALLFTITVFGVCLAMLLAMTHTVVSLWRNEHRTPPRMLAVMMPVETQDRRIEGMSFVGTERRRARQAAIEAVRKIA